MPRQARKAPGGLIYHVLNRGAGTGDLFRHDRDFAAFIRTLYETLERTPIRLCAFCLMSTHWHLVLWPEEEGELARFMQRLTITHVRRWIEHRHRVGMGPVYQGRYKSFPIQNDEHFTTVVRYVERNPVRAKMVKRAEEWRWSSLGQMQHPASEDIPQIPICPWPVVRRKDWAEFVNRAQISTETTAVAHAMKRSRPYGSDKWVAKIERQLRIGPLRDRGRPKNATKADEK